MAKSDDDPPVPVEYEPEPSRGGGVYAHISAYAMNDHLRDAAIAQSKSHAEIAQAKADEEKYRCAIPAQEERKRDVRKTGIVVFGVLAIVGVAAVRLDGANLGNVLIACVGVLTAAWGLSEGIKAYAKHKTKTLTPMS